MDRFLALFKASATILRVNPRLLIFIVVVLGIPIQFLQLSIAYVFISFKDTPVASVWGLIVLTLLLPITSLFLQSVLRSSLYFTLSHLYLQPGKPISIKEALNLSPRTWVRYSITNLWVFFISFVIALIPLFLLIARDAFKTWSIYLVISVLIVLGMFVILGLVTSLAGIVSVLEEVQGPMALRRGRELLRGNIWLGVGTLQLVSLGVMVFIQVVFRPAGTGTGGFSLWRMGLSSVVSTLALPVLSSMEVAYFFICNGATSAADHRIESFVPLKASDEDSMV